INSHPKLVVIMGGKTYIELNHLVRQSLITLPETMKVTHYAYIGQRPKGKLGPMHPQRIQEYDQEFSDVANLFHQLNK
ncbi:MAG: hypothetical protein PVG14_11615, partial [Anaerolineales bacterium]